jgi:hypothetical protein
MMDWEYHKLKAQVAVLKDVLETYPTATISCAIRQIESRIKYLENK